MVDRVPPSFISGSASFAMRMNDQQEMSIASQKAGLGAIDDAALQILLWREGDRMEARYRACPISA